MSKHNGTPSKDCQGSDRELYEALHDALGDGWSMDDPHDKEQAIDAVMHALLHLRPAHDSVFIFLNRVTGTAFRR